MRFNIIFLLFFSIAVFGQSVPLSPNAKVSILTCGSSPEIYALFGHTAIRINDSSQNLDIVYNYGAFDFNTPNFALKFVKGDMQYFVTSSSFYDFLDQYMYEKRSVSEQELNIPLEKKQQLFEKLNAVLFSNERYYTYKFIDRNCTNMAADVINKTLGGKVIYKRKNTETTYRNILYPYFDGHFYEQWGTSVLFGTKVDEQATVLFLPVELEESLALTTYNSQPLAPTNIPLLKFEEEKAPFSWWNNIYTYLLFLVVVVVVNRKGLNLFYLIVIGVLGLFFSFNGIYSLHEELAWNYNILLFNPILLLLAYFYGAGQAKWIYRTSLFLLIMLGIYLIYLFNKAHLLIVLPMIICNGILLVKLLLNSQAEKIS
jgi:hypothetical protein